MYSPSSYRNILSNPSKNFSKLHIALLIRSISKYKPFFYIYISSLTAYFTTRVNRSNWYVIKFYFSFDWCEINSGQNAVASSNDQSIGRSILSFVVTMTYCTQKEFNSGRRGGGGAEERKTLEYIGFFKKWYRCGNPILWVIDMGKAESSDCNIM